MAYRCLNNLANYTNDFSPHIFVNIRVLCSVTKCTYYFTININISQTISSICIQYTSMYFLHILFTVNKLEVCYVKRLSGHLNTIIDVMGRESV